MNVDISCTARHRNSVCGQGLQHIPKEIKFKIDCVTLKNWPRIWMISFKQNVPFPLKTGQVLAKPKQELQMVFMACFPLYQKAVKAKLFFCSFLTEEMPQCQNCEQRGSERVSKKATCPVQSPSTTAMPQLFLTSTRQERCSHRIDFFCLN